MIKRIREIIASPLVVIIIVFNLSIALTFGATAKFIYGKGYEEFVFKIIKDIHKFHKGHDLD